MAPARFFLLPLLALTPFSALATISTYAGTGIPAFSGDGGPATSAALNSPRGLTSDSSYLYVADTGNNRIRRIHTITRVITTVAGPDLNRPVAVALDNSGNLYISDQGNHRIRKVTLATGVAVTIAGTGSAGSDGDGGPGTSARLSSPAGICFLGGLDPALFIADRDNHRIRRLSLTTGIITTIAGTVVPGPVTAGDALGAPLNAPEDVAVYDAAAGSLVVSDTGNRAVRILTGSAVRGWSIATVPLRVPLEGARQVLPLASLILIADAASNQILSPDGPEAGTGAGGFSGDGGREKAASLGAPSGLARAGQIYFVADSANHRIRAIDPCEIGQVGSGETFATLNLPACNGPQVFTFSVTAGQQFMLRLPPRDIASPNPRYELLDASGAPTHPQVLCNNTAGPMSFQACVLTDTPATYRTYRFSIENGYGGGRSPAAGYQYGLLLSRSDCTALGGGTVGMGWLAGLRFLVFLLAGQGCAPTVSVDQPWVQLWYVNRTGSALVMEVISESNEGGPARTAHILVGGTRAVDLVQEQGPPCPSGYQGPAVPTQVPVLGLENTLGDWGSSHCRSNLVTTAPWITISGSKYSWLLTVAPNMGAQPRTAVLQYGSYSFTLTQASISATSTRQRYIHLLYAGFLARLPAPAEVAFRDSSAASPESMAASLFNSEECALTVRRTVLTYQALLGRYPTWRELTQRARRGDVADSLSQLTDGESFLKSGTDQEFTIALYQRVLGRTPAAPELTTQAREVSRNGRLPMVLRFLNSPEARLGPPELNVRMLYYGMLLRDPEEAGVRLHLQALNAGMPFSALIANFANSAEMAALLAGK